MMMATWRGTSPCVGDRRGARAARGHRRVRPPSGPLPSLRAACRSRRCGGRSASARRPAARRSSSSATSLLFSSSFRCVDRVAAHVAHRDLGVLAFVLHDLDQLLAALLGQRRHRHADRCRPTVAGFSPRSESRIAFSIAWTIFFSHGWTPMVRASTSVTLATWLIGVWRAVVVDRACGRAARCARGRCAPWRGRASASRAIFCIFCSVVLLDVGDHESLLRDVRSIRAPACLRPRPSRRASARRA